MIELLAHDDIDQAKWDACVLQSAIPLPYAESWYLDAVAPGWSALVRGDYLNVMPMCSGRKFTFDYLYQPALAQQLGVFGKEAESHSEDFIEAIPGRFKYIDIQLNEAFHSSRCCKECTQRKNMVLDLNRTLEEIRAAYSPNHRRNIRKAERMMPEIIDGGGHMTELIQLFHDNRADQVKLPHDFYPSLERVFASGIKLGRVHTSIAILKGRPAAGILWLKGKERCILLFSGANDNARRYGLMHKLVDHKIAGLSGQKMWLDFEGSDHHGLGRFYMGFGADVSLYLHLRRNRLPSVFKWLK